MNESKKVGVVIVNWNGLPLLQTCFRALEQQTYPHFEVFFVDNGSSDESVSYVREVFPGTHIIELPTNTGFAIGNNTGIAVALSDPTIKYIATLNNDTAAHPEFLMRAVSLLNSDYCIGSVAPKMKLFYENNRIDAVGITILFDGSGANRGWREVDSGQYDQTEEVFGPCAGAAIFRREMLEDIGIDGAYFDPMYFSYYEDVDLAWRARLRGWKCVSCPLAVVDHVHAATAGRFPAMKAFYMNRNRFFVAIKNFPFLAAVRALLFAPFRYLLLLVSIIRKRGASHTLSQNISKITMIFIVFRVWGSIMVHLPKLLHERMLIQSNRRATRSEIYSWFRTHRATIQETIFN